MGLSWHVRPRPLLGGMIWRQDESSTPHASETGYDGLGKGCD